MSATNTTPARGLPTTGTLRDGVLLAFIAAYVDTCGFIGLYGVFTAHVTGNFVLIGAVLVARKGELLARLLVLPMFVAAVAATTLAAHWCDRHRAPLAAPGLLCEAILLLATVATAWTGPGVTEVGTPLSLVAALLLSAAMGLQNALNRLSFPSLPQTTVMTGNVTQLSIDLVTIVTGRGVESLAAKRQEALRRVRRFLPLVLAFTMGAAGGAAGFAWLGFSSLLLPAAACLFLAVGAFVRRV